jgi:hypothetical protein
MSTELLRAPAAARRIGIPTKELVRLAFERKIRFVLVRGLLHFSPDVLDDYQAGV